MILLDSSCWIEYLMGGKFASSLEHYTTNLHELIIPTIVFYEVDRHLLKKIEKRDVLFVTAQMIQAVVVPLDDKTARFAAGLALEHHLGMADAVIYATALEKKAKLVTLDNDFRSLPGCFVMGSSSIS